MTSYKLQSNIPHIIINTIPSMKVLSINYIKYALYLE